MQQYALPPSPADLSRKYFPAKQISTAQKQARKETTDILVPLYPTLRQVVRLRKQSHSDLDDYWRTTLSEEAFERVTTPTLTIAGWYDLFLRNDLRHYQLMKQRGGSELARRLQHLVIGPWAHGNFMWGYADRQYGEGGIRGE
jgi:predicted acyl esterase